MDDLLVECPIHLEAVSIQDILVFRCGHGFCELCLEGHFSHHGSSSLSCPTCRKPVRRKEAFPLFLVPAQPGSTQSNHPTTEASHTRLIRELKEARAAHATCSGQIIELQGEINTLRQKDVQYTQTIYSLRGRNDLLEERIEKKEAIFTREMVESNRMKEEVTRLQVENHKISNALEQALRDVQVQLERVKLFQCRIERYKRKCALETKKRRKATESENHRPLPQKEDDSLMVVDANAPDLLRQDGRDFGRLDEACKVRGDRFTIPGDADSELELESEDEVQFSDPDTKQKSREDLPPESFLRFPSDWHLGSEALAGPSSGNTRKQRHGSRQMGGCKLVKVKLSEGAGAHKPVEGPLAIDRQGRIKRPVILGSRRKLNSKN